MTLMTLPTLGDIELTNGGKEIPSGNSINK